MTAAAPLIGSPEDHERREREDEDGTAARRRIEAQQHAARWHADQQRTPRQRLADADRMLGPLGDPWIGATDRAALQAERDLLAVEVNGGARLLGVWPDRSPEWFAARDSRVGGSDIGIICGWPTLNPATGAPLRTREQLTDERVNGRPEEKQQTAAQSVRGARRRGVYLEPAVLAWVADRADVEYDPRRSTGTWVRHDYPHRMFNPDAFTTDGRLVEAKTCDVRDPDHGWGRAGTDQVPLSYAAQAQWGMGVLGATETLLGVLSGCPRFEFALYRIRFDPDVYAYLCDAADQWLAEVNDLIVQRKLQRRTVA